MGGSDKPAEFGDIGILASKPRGYPDHGRHGHLSTPGQGLTKGPAAMVPGECGRSASQPTPPPLISIIPPMKKKRGRRFTPRPLDLKVKTSRGEQLTAFDTGGGTNKAAAEPMMTDSHPRFKERRTIKRS